MERINGALKCAVAEDWAEHKVKIDELTTNFENFLRHLEHLKKLDLLEPINETLLNAATGRKHVDIETFKIIIRTFSGVVFGLLFIIIALLTGQHLGILKLIQ